MQRPIDHVANFEPHLNDSRRAWVSPGTPVDIHGRTITAGGFYTGEKFPGLHISCAVESALINPRLKAITNTFTRPQHGYGSHFTYAGLNPTQRGAYLDWLAADRPTGHAQQFVQIFLHGIERRVLFDARYDESARAEVPALLSEAERLVHGLQQYERFYLDRVMDNLRLAANSLQPGFDPTSSLPPEGEPFFALLVPLALRLALGSFALTGRPLPAEWAQCWIRNEPRLRGPSLRSRCPEQYDLLFAAEYRQMFGDGLRLEPDPDSAPLTYTPLNPTFGGDVSIGIEPFPTVLLDGLDQIRLKTVVENVNLDLNEFVSSIPRGWKSPPLSSFAFFPDRVAPLWELPWVAPLVAEVDDVMDGYGAVLLERAPFMAVFPETVPTLTPRLAEAISLLFERLGYAIEPDPIGMKTKFSKSEFIAIYRLEFEPGQLVEYRDLSMLFALLAFWSYVAAAESGDAITRDRFLLSADVIATLAELQPFESNRLHAHALWLAMKPATLNDARRLHNSAEKWPAAMMAQMVTSLVLLQGAPSKKQIRALERVYQTLGRPEAELHSDLHQLSTTRSAGEAGTRPAQDFSPRRPGVLALDPDRILQVQHQTETVSSMLQEVFVDLAESTPKPPPDPQPEPWIELAKQLATQPGWRLADAARIAQSLGLMLTGAIEMINDRSIALFGAPALECDDDRCEVFAPALTALLSQT